MIIDKDLSFTSEGCTLALLSVLTRPSSLEFYFQLKFGTMSKI